MFFFAFSVSVWYFSDSPCAIRGSVVSYFLNLFDFMLLFLGCTSEKELPQPPPALTE